MSAQKSAVAFRALLYNFCSSILAGSPSESGRRPGPVRKWSIVNVHGLHMFEFDPPIFRSELVHMMRQAGLTPGPKGNDISHLSVLTDTSKMGCYSWSLTAGPPGLMGTCPGSTVGFMFRDGTSSVPLPGALIGGISDAARTSLIRRLHDSGVRMPRADQVFSRFICNDCYALKHKYASPTVALAQTWRTAWTKFAISQGVFVESLVQAIEAAVRKSENQRAKARTDSDVVATNNPLFFRIHDSGDFFSPNYTAAWFEIARRLPKVRFWAPTRVWADPKQLEALILSVGPIPRNMVIRPSSLWFGHDPPVVPGLGPGSTSGSFVVRRVSPDEIEVGHPSRTKSDVWVCPAYLPSSMGGGASPLTRNPARRLRVIKPGEIVGVPTPDKRFVFYQALLDPSTGSFVLDKHGRPKQATVDDIRSGRPVAAAQAFAPSGSCEVALGPNGSRPCRVCWCPDGIDNCLPVMYSQH